MKRPKLGRGGPREDGSVGTSTGGHGGPPPRWRFGDDPAVPAAVVARGGVLAIPTESSYGLAADPRSRRGVEAVYRLKRREAGKPLPVVVAAVDQLPLLGVDPEAPEARRAARCWPAALTVVLPLAAEAPPLPAAAGGRSVAVRLPDHPDLRALLAVTGPLTATSANPSGGEPLLDPEAAAALLVDAGPLAGGPPSTLVAFDGPHLRILRPGRIHPDRLAECLGPGRP